MFENDMIAIENGIVCLCKNKNLLSIDFPPEQKPLLMAFFLAVQN